MTMRSPEILWDCIIIGAGAAGSFAGYLIARNGHRVLILEQGKKPGQLTACGGCLSPFFIKKYNLEHVVESTSDAVEIRLGKKLATYLSPLPFGAMLRRTVLDEYLARKAVTAGASLFCNCRVFKVHEKAGEVHCRFVHTTTTTLYRGKCILLADGPATLGRSIGIGFDKSTQDFIPALKADVYVKKTDNRMKFVIAVDSLKMGYYWLFPKNNFYNAGTGGIPLPNKKDLHFLLDEFINEEFKGSPLAKTNIKGGIVPLETARIFALDKVVTIGDAAGLVNPMTGGGIHYALKSAEIVARMVNKALARKIVVNLRNCNFHLRCSPYYLWLKIMRMFFVLITRREKYRPLLLFTFLKLYFLLFSLTSKVWFLLTKSIKNS